MTDPTHVTLTWSEGGRQHTALWVSETGTPPPRRLEVVDDALTANDAVRKARAGTTMLWRGDYHNARQLLSAMARRLDAPSKTSQRRRTSSDGPAERFHKHRLAQSQRARALGQLVLQVEPGHHVPLRRAPNVSEALATVLGALDAPYVVSLRELLGMVSSLEWRKKGIAIEALGGDRISAHYGVFPPTRREYLDLVAEAPLPTSLQQHSVAHDIGTGTGVLAAMLARRGVERIVATDVSPRALDCARANLAHLGLAEQVELQQADLFPEGRAAIVVCNPPWLPAKPTSTLETAVYDPNSAMLRGWLDGLGDHLVDGGEGWLILSDLAEHLELRSRETLLGWFASANLQVIDRLDTTPTHKKSRNTADPLHAERAAEVTSLWRLGRA